MISGGSLCPARKPKKGEGAFLPPGNRGNEGGQECPPSLFFDDLLDTKLREFNPRYLDAEGALLGQFRHLHTDIYGNREFVEHLRNLCKYPEIILYK